MNHPTLCTGDFIQVKVPKQCLQLFSVLFSHGALVKFTIFYLLYVSQSIV